MLWELLKGLLTLLGALLIFLLGLLAWRQQLLDKRRFEVAEQVLVMYAKLAAQVRILRQRNDYDGAIEWIKAKADREPSDADFSYRWHMARRAWVSRVREKKQEAFNDVYKDFTATVALARMYLTDEITTGLQRISQIYDRVDLAAKVLATIDPTPTIDPECQSQYGEPSPDWPYDPDEEPSYPEACENEKLHFPIRFHNKAGPDAIDIEIDTAETFLTLACKPFTDQGPYQFLRNFVVTLIPPRGLARKR